MYNYYTMSFIRYILFSLARGKAVSSERVLMYNYTMTHSYSLLINSFPFWSLKAAPCQVHTQQTESSDPNPRLCLIEFQHLYHPSLSGPDNWN